MEEWQPDSTESRGGERGEERRQTSAAGLAPLGPAREQHTQAAQRWEIHGFMAATRDQDMSNDECNCVMVVKDVTDEVFFHPSFAQNCS